MKSIVGWPYFDEQKLLSISRRCQHRDDLTANNHVFEGGGHVVSTAGSNAETSSYFFFFFF